MLIFLFYMNEKEALKRFEVNWFLMYTTKLFRAFLLNKILF